MDKLEQIDKLINKFKRTRWMKNHRGKMWILTIMGLVFTVALFAHFSLVPLVWIFAGATLASITIGTTDVLLLGDNRFEKIENEIKDELANLGFDIKLSLSEKGKILTQTEEYTQVEILDEMFYFDKPQPTRKKKVKNTTVENKAKADIEDDAMLKS